MHTENPQSNENKVDQETEKCPVDHRGCEWLEELAELRQKIQKLNAQVHTDELTGLFNFRHFQEILPQEMERTLRSGSPTALLILDLDHFKKVNDTWGHENGNRVLVQTSRLIQATIRKIDIACRFGGEEIVLILPNTNIGHAAMVAERIRKIIENTPVDVPQGEIRYTTSIGVDIFTRDEDLTAEQFLERADKLLYEAKEGGRNRVVVRELEEQTVVTAEEKGMLLAP